MKENKLFLALIGGRQPDDKIEAHNVFVGVGESMQSLLPQVKKAWSGATHIDGYTILEQLDGYKIVVHESKEGEKVIDKDKFPKLVTYNIGYYKPGQLAEFHKLISMVLKDKNDKWLDRLKNDPDFAEGQALEEISRSHVDDTVKVTGVVFDADDEILMEEEIQGYTIELVPLEEGEEVKSNELVLGYHYVKELKEIVF